MYCFLFRYLDLLKDKPLYPCLIDGEGTVITSETCFLNPNRNPGWTKSEVEQELLRTLGASKVIWVPGNADEDETNGHIDGLAQYIRPGVVLAEITYDIDHPWFDIMQDNIIQSVIGIPIIQFGKNIS